MSGLSGAAPQVYSYFARLYGPTAAAGIVGNTQQESSNRPDAEGGGLIQGQGGRTSGGSLMQQLLGVRHELEGPERATLQALRGAKGPREAARIFSERFERPGVPMLGNRERYALEALKEYGKGALGHATAAEGLGESQSQGGLSSGTLTALIGALGQQQQSVAGVSLPKPTGEPETQARAPRELPQQQPVAPSSLLSLLSTVSQGEGSGSVQQQPQAGAAKGASGTGAITGRVGVTGFAGKQVADWIAPVLQYAQQHGWKGTVSSGYRSYAEQKRIYDSGVRPAAVPGTSNHEGDQFPRGAVDVTEAAQLAKILQGSPYAKLLVWAGSKDPVHFSHPHNGSY